MTPRRLIEPARLAGTSMLRTQSDARLVDLVRAGHASAFEAIVQRYRKPLLAYCSRLLPASRAEDAVQQTFLKAYQAMVSGDAELNLRPWLYRIAHNASLNLLRQNGWSHEQLDENMDGVERPDQALELRERLHSTVEAVKALPDRQRNAVLLREIDGLSYEEIALALGVGDGAVRQLLHRARATLRAGMTAVTPVGIVERVSAALAGTGGDPSSRVAELAAGAGFGAGAAKLGVAALATGVIATGAVAVPIVKHARHSRSGGVEAAAAAIPVKPAVTPASQATPVDEVNSGSSHRHAASHAERHHASSGPGSRGHGPSAKHGSPLLGGGGGGGDTQQPRQEHHSGSGDGGGDHHSGGGSGGGDDHSGGGSGGSDDGLRTPSGDGGGQHSGSDDPVGTIAPPTGTSDPTGSVIDPSGHDGGGSGGSDDGSTSGSGSDGSGSGSSSGSGS